jgi:glutaredoxin
LKEGLNGSFRVIGGTSSRKSSDTKEPQKGSVFNEYLPITKGIDRVKQHRSTQSARVAMKTSVKVMLACFVWLCFSAPASSQVYKWRDKDGNLIISTTPPPPDTDTEQIKIETPKNGESESVRPSFHDSEDPELAEKRPYGNVKVLLYTTRWCPYCSQARAYLKSLHVDLTEYDIEKNPDKNQEKLSKTKGSRGVPVIDIEGIIQVGFSKEAVKAAIEEKRTI